MKRMTLIVVAFEAVLVAVALLGGWWLGTPILEITRVDPSSGLLALAATLPLIAIVLSGMRGKSASAAKIQEMLRKTIVPLFGSCSPLEILLMSIMAGIGEELFFRGLLQGSLSRVVNPWIALVLVNVLFGLAHYASRSYAIMTFLLGIYMGTLLLLTGNLFVAIAVHALFDVVALLLISRMAPLPAVEPDSP